MQIIAHRGASYFEPENTLRSIKRAIEMNADYVEVDVRMSKDKELIIMHDADISRTTNGTGLVKDKTLLELKEYDAGNGEEIPTLDEVLETVKNKIKLVVEIKEPGTEEKIVEKIIANKLKDTIITSFFHKAVKNVMDSDINAGIIFVGQPVNVGQMASAANANIIFPSYRYMDEELVKDAKRYGLSVYPWAIDDPEIFEKFVRMNVDGIVTNKLMDRTVR
ncbi:MAG: glycerophosphodiester phosphodiesterase family protein [Methanobacterium sp.]|nr:glycerophosphodiester phosphodiesterase family protein [Methanobacterium sp.]